jgi:hypothetical protein
LNSASGYQPTGGPEASTHVTERLARRISAAGCPALATVSARPSPVGSARTRRTVQKCSTAASRRPTNIVRLSVVSASAGEVAVSEALRSVCRASAVTAAAAAPLPLTSPTAATKPSPAS